MNVSQSIFRQFQQDTDIHISYVYSLSQACEIISENPLTIGGDDECTSIGTVPVTIKDVNDNAPILDRGIYTYSLLESSPTGHILNEPPITPFDKDTVCINVLHYFDFLWLTY